MLPILGCCVDAAHVADVFIRLAGRDKAGAMVLAVLEGRDGPSVLYGWQRGEFDDTPMSYRKRQHRYGRAKRHYVQSLSVDVAQERASTILEGLSGIDLQICQSIMEGHTQRDTAKQLGISEMAVSRILKKIGDK